MNEMSSNEYEYDNTCSLRIFEQAASPFVIFRQAKITWQPCLANERAISKPIRIV
jgi:hypothetical protein